MRNAIGTRAVRLLIPAAALLGVGGLAILPGTAMGDPGYTLNMSGPATVTPGQATIFQAAGANPPSDFFSSWLDVSAIPTSVLATCPDDYLNASQIADSASAQGGERVVVGQRETVDANGNFSIPFGYSPRIAGIYLLCAYSNDGATYTLAKASLNVRVDAGGPPPPPIAPQPPSQPQTSSQPRHDAQAGQRRRAPRRPFRTQAHLPARNLVAQPAHVRVPLAHRRQAKARRNNLAAGDHAIGPRPHGAMRSDRLQRGWPHCGRQQSRARALTRLTVDVWNARRASSIGDTLHLSGAGLSRHRTVHCGSV